MKKRATISEAEWPIMELLWERKTATAAEIVAEVTRRRSVSMRTVKTLIRRLIAKEMVDFRVDEHDARVYHYQPRIAKQEGVAHKNQSLLDLVYNNNVGELLVNFVKTTRLSKAEIEQLQELLRKKQEESQPGSSLPGKASGNPTGI